MSAAPVAIEPTYLKCLCAQTAIRRRTLSSGVVIFALQCLSCGRQIKAVKKDSPEARRLGDIEPFDESLQQAWHERTRAFYDERRQAQERQRELDDAAWWRWYSDYLKTTAWRLKRQAVLTRANNWCEGCAARQATQVHHKTYDHVGNELLFELVAVCDECHHILHPEMDER